ncbi:MAG: cobalamin B12-binding domain-containing protein [Chloroflexota bacterium]|nr:cobalamin B12-binding domain-containing protein [Chloroflexota bacterium]
MTGNELPPQATEPDSASRSTADARPIRVVLAKAGMDGHDRGVKVVARILRDAGFEVIYTGLYQTPESVVNTALQEDADAVGLSVLSAAHKHLFAETARLMREQGMSDVVLFGGGIIPPNDVLWLEQQGVKRIFLPGASGPEIVEFVRQAVAERRARLS